MTDRGDPATGPSASGIVTVNIRRYEAGDRAIVRTICCDTANRGEPVEPVLPDRELVADLLTRYYTDYDPAASWVAESGGTVIGYLTGCFDTRRYGQIMSRQIAPQAVMEAIARGVLGSPEAWRFIGAGVHAWVQGVSSPPEPLERFPAHLHINVQRAFRGRDVGRRLVKRFILQAREGGVAGVHARVRGDHPAACRFFEAMGFQAMSRQPMVWPDGPAGGSHEAVVYGRPI